MQVAKYNLDDIFKNANDKAGKRKLTNRSRGQRQSGGHAASKYTANIRFTVFD